MKKYATGSMVLVWMAVIFLFSAQDATKSSHTSQSVSYRIVKWQSQFFGQEKTEEELLSQAEGMQLVVRKGAHMGEYAVLAIFFASHLGCYPFSDRKRLLLALGLSACYAASDEFHQVFVPGRAGRLTDVCIDSLGSLAGLTFYFGAAWFWKKGRLRRGPEDRLD